MTFLTLLLTTFLPWLQVSSTGWASAQPEPSLTPRNVDTPPASSEGKTETRVVVPARVPRASAELLENETPAFTKNRERRPWSSIKRGERTTEHGVCMTSLL